jgi:hypothetical protein
MFDYIFNIKEKIYFYFSFRRFAIILIVLVSVLVILNVLLLLCFISFLVPYFIVLDKLRTLFSSLQGFSLKSLFPNIDSLESIGGKSIKDLFPDANI